MRLAFFRVKVLLLFLFLLQNQSLVGKENAQFEQVKCYVATENIGICEDGILISGGESLVLVMNLFLDEQGYYFLNTDECGWICNWCGTINPLDANTCKRCGESYGSRPPKKR